ncbi:hypothetical protein B0O99DRAFT_611480 [Bisporella sp. PMI_857]|nr:hypothetical protein B0O99DRAFT_611480 [Bisporella sp. PMI_857]
MMRHKLQTTADVLTPPTVSLLSFLPLILPFSSLSSQQRILKRYTSIFWTFWVSGVCHIMMDLWTQISWSETRAMKFFCIQVLGIILEDSVQEAWRRGYLGPRSQGEKGKDGEEEEKNIWWGRVLKVVGLGWTIAWLVYTTPIWIYPGLRRAQAGPKGGLLPFSILKSAFRQG